VGKKSQDETMRFVMNAAQTHDPDPAHNEQVTLLSLALFDGLRGLHGFGPAERRLFEIASRLHDIGWSQVVSGKHHKLSRDMILKLDIPGLDEQDRLLCALVARYHTKALPDASRHQSFASLTPERRDLVEWLSGLLRVADGLDCAHAYSLRKLTVSVSHKAITIHIETEGDCRIEIERARQKQVLLERKTGRRIRYQC
jgi:exopolyphosphatase/guanosine-5'-triphosphate,3'-diphosphate pyrophosphatase